MNEYNPSERPDWHPMRVQQQPRVVDNRKPYPRRYSAGPVEGDRDRLPEGRREIAQARACMKVQCEVAPRARLELANGEWLEGGAKVTLEQLRGDADFADAQRWMQTFISMDPPVVIEIPPEEVARRNPSAERNRYRIGARAVTSKGTVLAPGQWVSADDFEGQEAEPAIEAAPAEKDWAGNIKVPARPAFAARPAISGEEVLQSNITRGLVIDTHAGGGSK